MNEEINKALKVPEIAGKLSGQGMTIVGGPPDVARSFIDKQIDTWGVVVKETTSRRIDPPLSSPASLPAPPGTAPPCCRSRWRR